MNQKTTEITIHDEALARQAHTLQRVALVNLDKPKHFTAGFFTMFQSYLLELHKHNFSGREWNVLSLLLAHLDYANNVVITHAEIARMLETPRQNVSKAFKRLEDAGCITKTTIHGINTYKLNADFVWKGKGKNHCSARASQARQRVKSQYDTFISKHAKDAIAKIRAGVEFFAAIDRDSLTTDEYAHVVIETEKLMKKLGVVEVVADADTVSANERE